MPEIETEGVFDSAGYQIPDFGVGPFPDNPMKMLAGMMGDLKDMALHRGPFVLPSAPPLEHKVRIYQLVEEYNLEALEQMAAEMEAFLNDGYCCHMPTVVNNYVIMDFSRRKEPEENEREQ